MKILAVSMMRKVIFTITINSKDDRKKEKIKDFLSLKILVKCVTAVSVDFHLFI